MKEIDLANPGYGVEMPMPVSDAQREPDYPTLHLEGSTDLELPDEGTITFVFKRVSETESVRKDGSERYSCTLEIRKLLSVEGPKDERPSKTDTSAADALDGLMKARQAEKEY